MSFSLIHDLNSLTAKAADTPDGKENQASGLNVPEQKWKLDVSGVSPHPPSRGSR